MEGMGPHQITRKKFYERMWIKEQHGYPCHFSECWYHEQTIIVNFCIACIYIICFISSLKMSNALVCDFLTSTINIVYVCTCIVLLRNNNGINNPMLRSQHTIDNIIGFQKHMLHIYQHALWRSNIMTKLHRKKVDNSMISRSSKMSICTYVTCYLCI